ncbi:MAG: enolase C-terminal domain-like protein [Saprospiraceae bacterium]
MSITRLLQQPVSLAQLDLFLIDLPQVGSFRSGIGVRNSREALIVKWTDREGRVGYGECACRPDPFYSGEYRDAAADVIQRFIAPFLKGEQTYGDVITILKKVRGWNFTKAAVEAAMFQVVRQTTAINLSDFIAAKPIEKVPVGISLGIYKDKAECYEVVKKSIGEGFQRLKFKISPEVDTEIFDHINPLLFDNKIHTGFDANGSFYEKDLDLFGYFAKTYDTVIEQPFPPNRFDVLLEAKRRFPNLKICADEEVKSIGDLIKLHKLNAIDELNLKIGRVGGVVNSIEIMNYCNQHNIPCWIGGMFETGIGRVFNLEFAAHLPNAKAHDLSPSARYFLEDIIDPVVTMDKGFVPMESLRDCKVVEPLLEKYMTERRSVFDDIRFATS